MWGMELSQAIYMITMHKHPPNASFNHKSRYSKEYPWE